MMKKWFSVVMSVLLVCASLFLSACNSGKDETKIHTSDVIHCLCPGEYGNFIYFGGRKLTRYNRVTNELMKACVDPECTGKCTLEGIITDVLGVYDGKVFFWSWVTSSEYVYGYQDVISGEVTVLVELNEEEGFGREFSFVEDGCFYFMRKYLRDGGSAENSEDYEEYICRIHLDSLKEERMRKADSEVLVMVADGTIVTRKQGQLFAYDLDFNNRRVLFDCEANGFRTILNKYDSLDGKIFFLCNYYLLSADFTTGEWKKVVEEPVSGYCLTDDALYYSRAASRYLYMPEDPDNPDDPPVMYGAEADLHRLELSSGKDTVVYSNEYCDFLEQFTVIDNALYGRLYVFDTETHKWMSPYTGKIDFKSGTITPATQIDE